MLLILISALLLNVPPIALMSSVHVYVVTGFWGSVSSTFTAVHVHALPSAVFTALRPGVPTVDVVGASPAVVNTMGASMPMTLCAVACCSDVSVMWLASVKAAVTAMFNMLATMGKYADCRVAISEECALTI